MAPSSSMDLDKIRVPGLLSHHSKQLSSQPQVPADQAASSWSANPSNSASSVDITQLTPIWSPAKHIPKSARTSCASHLAALLRKTVSNPDSTSNWLELFNWGHIVLHAPKRGGIGKRHNLTSAIKLRISTYSAGQPDCEFANSIDKARRQGGVGET